MVNYTNYILIKSPGITALESLSYGLLVLDTYFFFRSIFTAGCCKTVFQKTLKSIKNPLVKSITADKLILMGCLNPCPCVSLVFIPRSQLWRRWREKFSNDCCDKWIKSG